MLPAVIVGLAFLVPSGTRPLMPVAARLATRMDAVVMQAGPQELLSPEAWVESGASALQKLPATCKRFNQQAAEAEHLAIALLEQGGERGMASKVLANAGASPAAVKKAFEAFANNQPKVFNSNTEVPEGQLNVGRSLVALLQSAGAQRSLLTDDYLSAEHVLLALLNDDRCGRKVMREAMPGISQQTLRAAIDQVRNNQRITSRSSEETYEALEKYARDLTYAPHGLKPQSFTRRASGSLWKPLEASGRA